MLPLHIYKLTFFKVPTRIHHLPYYTRAAAAADAFATPATGTAPFTAPISYLDYFVFYLL